MPQPRFEYEITYEDEPDSNGTQLRLQEHLPEWAKPWAEGAVVGDSLEAISRGRLHVVLILKVE